jgi:transposase-like protein
MNVKLHANATTTPKTRAYIQASTAPVAELAEELGVSETTIRRWRSRSQTTDRSHAPHHIATVLSPTEEALICELRRDLALSLDDITEVMRRCLAPALSRSSVHRCLKRHDLNQPAKAATADPGVFEPAQVGFIHADLKHLPTLRRVKSYVFVAIDRATRFVHVEIVDQRDAHTIAGCLERFLAAFPHPVHTVLTDNGAEFTDRFAVDMKRKPEGKPSGNHPFDRLCASAGIDHRLTRPFHPQTNGMVERFNRRLAEAIRNAPLSHRNSGKNRFDNHADRNAFIERFVHCYNRTRLRCLDYIAPLEAITNLPKHNTCAGAHLTWRFNAASRRRG